MYTTSKLIIEDCTRLTFHELQYAYPSLEADLLRSGLHGHNFWKDVQDFKWIKKERSPNFTLVFDGKEQAPEAAEQPVFHNPAHAVSAHVVKAEEPAKTMVQEKLGVVEEQRVVINSDKFELPKPFAQYDAHAAEMKKEAEKPVVVAEVAKPEPAKKVVDDDEDIDEL